MPFTVIVVCIYCLRSCLSIIVLYLWIFLVSFRLDIDGFYFLWILDISILIFHYQIGIVDYYFFRFVVGLFSILDCWTVCFSDCFFLSGGCWFCTFPDTLSECWAQLSYVTKNYYATTILSNSFRIVLSQF